MSIKIAVVGAGSSYTPEIIEGLMQRKDTIPVREVALYDINERRLEIMANFCRRYAAHMNYDVKITHTTNRTEALTDADFLNVQIRVGGNQARVQDEKIPLSYGIVGQETTGPGGFMKACRTIPVMIDLAREVERVCPNAWIVNYTNPTGLVTQAVQTNTNAKIAGLCAGGFFPRDNLHKYMGFDRDEITYDYFGLNHMNFAYNVMIGNRPLTREEFDTFAERQERYDPEEMKTLGMFLTPYLRWYYNTQELLDKNMKAEKTRGEMVLEIEKEIFEALEDPNCVTKPEALKRRGGGGYSEIAIGIIEAMVNNRDRWMVINVPNKGTIPFLPDDAVIETGCLVNAAGIHPLKLSSIPESVWGLTCAVKNYEQLAVKAAVTGDRRTAYLALMAHPLVRDWGKVKPMLDEMLEANRAYLPQFFPNK
ncbi:MAG: 6-phospho-beta-glucosidase [Clostridia bacterium]|nr:6-phospho-beta-glucosidase [Clostridia bacterium]